VLIVRKDGFARHANPVAKYMHEFNKASVIPDKKKRKKSGYVKHRKEHDDGEYCTDQQKDGQGR